MSNAGGRHQGFKVMYTEKAYRGLILSATFPYIHLDLADTLFVLKKAF